MYITPKTGQWYDLSEIRHVGWTIGDGSGSEGYALDEFFDSGFYIGPDIFGIEPIIESDEGTPC